MKKDNQVDKLNEEIALLKKLVESQAKLIHNLERTQNPIPLYQYNVPVYYTPVEYPKIVWVSKTYV